MRYVAACYATLSIRKHATQQVCFICCAMRRFLQRADAYGFVAASRYTRYARRALCYVARARHDARFAMAATQRQDSSAQRRCARLRGLPRAHARAA